MRARDQSALYLRMRSVALQVLKYAASWRKGPVMLLLCEASAEVADLPVLKRIAELREGGRSLFVVAAGRWAGFR